MSVIHIQEAKKKMETPCVFQRVEKKFLLNEEQLNGWDEAMLKHMTLDSYGLSTIGSIYFDSDSLELIRTSADKPLYKEKFRLRGYGKVDENSTLYAEIKKKYKGIVYKRREAIPLKEFKKWNAEDEVFPVKSQIGREIDYMFKHYGLKPKVYIAYDRMAYFGNDDSALRVTIDKNIRFRTSSLDLTKGSWGTNLLEEGQYLMEIKIPGALPMWMVKAMEEYEIVPTSFSKVGLWYEKYYCAKAQTEEAAHKAADNIFDFKEVFAVC